YGGYETLVRYLAPYLVRAGHDVTVYCRARENGHRSWTVNGVQCVATPGRDSKSLSTPTFGLSSALDASLRRFDAVLMLNIANGFWCPLLRAARLPVVVNTDGIEWERGKWSKLGKTVFRAGARASAMSANRLICDSRAIGSIWEDLFDRESTFIPYGAPILEDVGRDELDHAGIPDEPYLLVVARLVPENNVELTLDALDQLGTEAPRAIVVGSANFASPLERRLEAMQNEGRVQWLGHVSNQQLLSQLWGQSAVYVHGHSVGGTNPALLQALGAGAPTLALNTPFNREVLPYPDQLFESDPAGLSRKIRTVLDSTALQDELSSRGRDVIRRGYLWDDVCKGYMDTMISLVR
ncbi:MAG TPA: glycosyltransferase, partial [Solirubrobacterales bacterium]